MIEPRWWKTSAGYLEGREPDGRVVKAHRWVIEQALGRRLSPAEIVHHRNGKRTDNRLDNLEVTTRSQHALMHLPENVRFIACQGSHHLTHYNRTQGPWNKGKIEMWSVKCSACGSSFDRSARAIKHSIRRGYQITCSRRCGSHLRGLARARGEE